MEWGVSDMLSTIEATIFIKKTIRELLFEGYEDTVMEIGSSMSDYEFEEVEENNDDKQKTIRELLFEGYEDTVMET